MATAPQWLLAPPSASPSVLRRARVHPAGTSRTTAVTAIPITIAVTATCTATSIPATITRITEQPSPAVTPTATIPTLARVIRRTMPVPITPTPVTTRRPTTVPPTLLTATG